MASGEEGREKAGPEAGAQEPGSTQVLGPGDKDARQAGPAASIGCSHGLLQQHKAVGRIIRDVLHIGDGVPLQGAGWVAGTGGQQRVAGAQQASLSMVLLVGQLRHQRATSRAVAHLVEPVEGRLRLLRLLLLGGRRGCGGGRPECRRRGRGLGLCGRRRRQLAAAASCGGAGAAAGHPGSRKRPPAGRSGSVGGSRRSDGRRRGRRPLCALARPGAPVQRRALVSDRHGSPGTQVWAASRWPRGQGRALLQHHDSGRPSALPYSPNSR